MTTENVFAISVFNINFYHEILLTKEFYQSNVYTLKKNGQIRSPINDLENEQMAALKIGFSTGENRWIFFSVSNEKSFGNGNYTAFCILLFFKATFPNKDNVFSIVNDMFSYS